MGDRGCESIPKLDNICNLGNEESMTYGVFFAVFSSFLEYFHSLACAALSQLANIARLPMSFIV